MLKLILIILLTLHCANVFAQNTKEIVAKASAHIVKVRVSFENTRGFGSGVVVAKNKVVTNCHVVADALSATIQIDQKSYPVSGLIPDWQHDLCVLKVQGLEMPVVKVGDSESLRYEQPVYAVGFAGDAAKATARLGVVKALYPLDGSVVVQATNPFKLGDSGGGLFNQAGVLVGIIAVKSPGKQPNYYNMPVAWLKPLINQKVQPFKTKAKPAFWAKSPENWPYFMQVVHPRKTQQWDQLHKVATAWVLSEPNTVEAKFYRAVAEYKLGKVQLAQMRFKAVIKRQQQHIAAQQYLKKIEKSTNLNHISAMLSTLAPIDQVSAFASRN